VQVDREEKLVAKVNRDGGIENFEVKGEVNLKVYDANKGQIKLLLNLPNDPNVQMKVIVIESLIFR
jgi:hypothetical protein